MEYETEAQKLVRESLTKELEGKLFSHMYMWTLGKECFFEEQLYIVRNGIVYYLNAEGKPVYCDDKLIDMKAHCFELGKYNPNRAYKRKKRRVPFHYLYKSVFPSDKPKDQYGFRS